MSRMLIGYLRYINWTFSNFFRSQVRILRLALTAHTKRQRQKQGNKPVSDSGNSLSTATVTSATAPTTCMLMWRAFLAKCVTYYYNNLFPAAMSISVPQTQLGSSAVTPVKVEDKIEKVHFVFMNIINVWSCLSICCCA